MSTCNINVLALGAVSQVSAMVAVLTLQLPPAANDKYGQFTLPSETSLQITVDVQYRHWS